MKPIELKIADLPNHLDRPAPPPADTVSLGHLIRVIRRRRWRIVLPVLVCLGLGIAYLVTTPKVYQAQSLVLLDAGVNRAVVQAGSLDPGSLTEAALENARLTIRSDAIAEAVVDDLGLTANPSFLAPPQSGLARLIGGAVGAVRAGVNLLRTPDIAAPDPGIADPQAMQAAMRRLAARALQMQIGIDRVGRSSAVAISYASHDPVLAAGVANGIAEAYIADVLNANFDATARTTEWMQERLAGLEAEAHAAAAQAERFRAENGLVALRGVSISEEAVAQLNTRTAEAVAEVARARALVASYARIVDGGVDALIAGGASGAGGVEDAGLAAYQQDLTEALATLARVERAFGTGHAQAVALRGQVQLAAERLAAQLGQRYQRAQGDLAIAEAKVAALGESLGLAIDSNSASGGAEVEYRALQQRAETLATLYQSFLTRFQSIEQQKSFPIANVRILSAADVPRAAAGPSSRQAVLGALVLGLICAAVLVAKAEWSERFLRTAEDVAEETGAAFLGYLPRYQASPEPARAAPETAAPDGLLRFHRTAAPTPGPSATPVVGIEALRHPRSLFAETLRSIRLAVDVTRNGQEPAVIGITAARPGEGKSTVSLNFAAVLGLSGARVLLIDCDIRRPGLSSQLGVVQGVGLIEAVLGRQPWRQCVRQVTACPGVQVLPCIPMPGLNHSAELLSSRAMRDLLAEARKDFDYVVVDLSPLGAVVDARVMMPQLDGVVLVAAWGQTPKSMLKRLIAANPALRDRLLGAVLNKVDMAALRGFVDTASADAYLEEYGDYFSDAPVPAGGAPQGQAQGRRA